MRETWYVLDGGTAVDPNEVAPDESGKLFHKSGVAVAMRGDTPSSRGVNADEERAKAQSKSKGRPKDMKPEEAKGGYTTREAKAD
jgi:hypothetical protein